MEKVALGRCSFEREEWENISSSAKSFIKKMLEKDVNKRLSAEQALQDSWIQQFCKQNNNLT